MNAPLRAPDIGMDSYLFASNSGTHITWLLHALQRSGTVVPVTPNIETLDAQIATISPRAVFLDFSQDHAAAIEMHQHLKRDWPALPVLGTGSASEPTTMLAALRAGVDDFIDMAAPAQDVLPTLRALLERRAVHREQKRGHTIALLGARAGLGVTTLATHVALLLQDQFNQAVANRTQASNDAASDERRGVALLDLGLPARDGLLYLDTQSSFSFVDGVHNLRRLDQTLLQTALAHHTGGTAVLPLPSSLAQVREISHADSVALIKRLSEHFDFQIADLGGFSTIDFIAQTVQEADKTWVVCDQSIGAIVSTANLLRDLQARGIELQRLSLVINKIDPGVGLSARDIAARLRLPLAHVLPMRRTALLAASSRGEMLARVARNDPYVQAVLGMVNALHREYGDVTAPAPARSPWNAFMTQFAGKWKSPREH
ncbi:histidine kinase [Variovorax sp. UMC13]|uniref:AAA family ATPase n=1 Tax=Variovorax sp. UMC13 TaxID=1862326 RepID=UPI001600686F|nr:histidine kinase [Variovorax sp. UMC13]MBB1599332.1 histidine kinase [Variovorax sp. UMC13]